MSATAPTKARDIPESQEVHVNPKLVARTGQVVPWYRDMEEDLPALPALVTGFNMGRCDLSIFDKDNQNLILRPGVPHADDEWTRRMLQAGTIDDRWVGPWRHTEDNLWIIELRKKIEESEKKGK